MPERQQDFHYSEAPSMQWIHVWKGNLQMSISTAGGGLSWDTESEDRAM